MGEKLTKAQMVKLLPLVMRAVRRRIGELGSGSRIAAGLSSEGFDGGYIEALNDVEAMLRHGAPRDDRGYWRAALAEAEGEKS